MYRFVASNIDELPSEHKEYQGNTLILRLGNKTLTENIDFMIIPERKFPCSEISICARCGRVERIECQGMCHNCYVRTNYTKNHMDEHMRYMARRAKVKHLREERSKKALKETYPTNLLLKVYEPCDESITSFPKDIVENMTLALQRLSANDRKLLMEHFRLHIAFRKLAAERGMTGEWMRQKVNDAVQHLRAHMLSVQAEKATPEEITPEFVNTLIWAHLSTRAKTVLAKMDISDVAELCALLESDPETIGGMTPAAVESIKTVLEEHGAVIRKSRALTETTYEKE